MADCLGALTGSSTAVRTPAVDALPKTQVLCSEEYHFRRVCGHRRVIGRCPRIEQAEQVNGLLLDFLC
jgi:hypothetical protein